GPPRRRSEPRAIGREDTHRMAAPRPRRARLAVALAMVAVLAVGLNQDRLVGAIRTRASALLAGIARVTQRPHSTSAAAPPEVPRPIIVRIPVEAPVEERPAARRPAARAARAGLDREELWGRRH